MKGKKLASLLFACAIVAGMSANTFAAENDQMLNDPNPVLQAVSMDEANEVLEHIKVDFSSEKGLIKDIEPTVTVQKVLSPTGRSAESKDMYAITVEKPILFNSGLSNTEESPTMDASVRATIYYSFSDKYRHLDTIRLEYFTGSGLIFFNKTYYAKVGNDYERGTVPSYVSDFEKDVYLKDLRGSTISLNAKTDVSGNGGSDHIDVNVRFLV